MAVLTQNPDAHILRLVTSGAFAAALEKLLPLYTPPVGYGIDVSYGSSLGAARDSIPTRLSQGERFDIYLLAKKALTDFTGQGFIDPDSQADLVSSDIGACVRSDDPAPAIGTADELRAALLAAGKVGHAASASGIYLSTEVIPALGIAEQMKDKAFAVYSERVGAIVARGEANLGFQQISEILPIPGVKMIGRLPLEFRRPFRFCAGIGTGSAHVAAARHLIAFLASPAAGPIIESTGLEPLFPMVHP